MIGIQEIPEPGAVFDTFEAGLMLPVPGQTKNTVVLEERDGRNVQRFMAKRVEFTVDNKTVFRASDIKIDCFITDARVAFACSKYDKGGGWIGSPVGMVVLNAGSKALAAIRRRGKMMVGQARYPWIAAVGSTERQGWGSEERLIVDGKLSASSRCRLTLQLPNDVSAARIAAEIAQRAACYRLTADPELNDEEQAALTALQGARPLSSPGKNKIAFHQFPTFFNVGDFGARLLPSEESASPTATVSPLPPPPYAEAPASLNGASAVATQSETPIDPLDDDFEVVIRTRS